MAVVQNLARPTAGQLAACRRSVDELNRLCSFRMLPDDDYLDLDWAPVALVRLAGVVAMPPGTAEAIERALTRENEVNPAYRDAHDTIFEHPVSALEPAEVAQVADDLAGLDPRHLIAQLRGDAVLLAEKLGLEPGVRDPAGYALHHLTALRTFYLGARDHGRAVVLWWD